MMPCEIAEPPSEPASKRIPGSNAFVPPVAGLIIAGEVHPVSWSEREGGERQVWHMKSC